MLLRGVAALSDQELIAILINNGFEEDSALDLASHILKMSGYSLHNLARLSVSDLSSIRGIGPAKAVTLIAALELGRRQKFSTALQKKKITTSRDVYEYFSAIMSDLPHEEMWMITLDNANHVTGSYRIGQGGITGTVVDVRLVLKTVILGNATQFIVAHNHPSGNMNPSDADKSITKKLQEGGAILDIRLLDHLIICPGTYFSFADNGLM
jgi:DNA repair protein RadC